VIARRTRSRAGVGACRSSVEPATLTPHGRDLSCGDMTVVLMAVAAVVSLGLVVMCQGARQR